MAQSQNHLNPSTDLRFALHLASLGEKVDPRRTSLARILAMSSPSASDSPPSRPPPVDPARQIPHLLDQLRGRDGETLAVRGAARLLKPLDGKLELRGGTPDNRRAAREWRSRFLPGAPSAGDR